MKACGRTWKEMEGGRSFGRSGLIASSHGFAGHSRDSLPLVWNEV